MIDLVVVKAHLRVRHSEDDIYIQDLITDAVDTFNARTNRTLVAADGQLPDPVGNAIRMTGSIRRGALLLIAHWYSNRETAVIGTITSELPMATQYLWESHRWINVR
ncbi:head-tail connector protein [Pseudomonas nitroreducens]|uniref:head-tail connector protein n=1 Tax=Pseudomonas nitroreducens TaxID=46680 RepID=UPI003D29881D